MENTSQKTQIDSIFAINVHTYVSDILNHILQSYAKSKEDGIANVERRVVRDTRGETYRFLDTDIDKPIVGVRYESNNKTFLLL